MPYYAMVAPTNLFTNDVTAAAIIERLTESGHRGAAAFDLYGPVDVSLDGAVGTVLPLKAGQALILAWTDDESLGQLASALKEMFGERAERIGQNPNSPNARIYGVNFTSRDSGGAPWKVVACVDRARPPSGPWRSTVDYDETTNSLLITDLLNFYTPQV